MIHGANFDIMLRTLLAILIPVVLCVAVMPVAAAPAAEPAAEPHWVPVHFGSIDGMPVDSAHMAVIDGNGFLWLATHDGLTRFDGEHFQVHDSMRFPAMSSNRISTVRRGVDERVYALTEQGDLVTVRSGRVLPVMLDGQVAADVMHVGVGAGCLNTKRALYCRNSDGKYEVRLRFPDGVEGVRAVAGRGGSVWLVSRRLAVWLYRDDEWRLVRQTHLPIGSQPPYDVIVDHDNRLWMAVRQRVVRVAADGSMVRFDGDGALSVIERVRLGRDGDVWLGTGDGVFAVRGGQLQPVFAVVDRPHGSSSVSWDAPDGALWVADGDRLWRLPPGTLRGNSRMQPVLQTRGVVSNLLFGEHGEVWVTTLHDGLYRLTRARVDVLDRAHGLPGNNVYGVTRGKDGSMWLGTLDSGVIRVAPDGRMRRYGEDDGLPGMLPWAVASAPDGGLLAATYAPGLWRLDPGTETFHEVRLPPGLRSASIRALLFDDDDLWLGTSNGAWRRQGTRWYKAWPIGAESVRINSVVVTDKGWWFGGDGGVWFRRGDKHYAVAARLLGDSIVRNLRFTADGALWISTEGRGLVRVAADDPRGEHALQLGRAQGLPSNSPHTVRQDAAGNIWVNSNQGIFRITGNGLRALMSGEVRSLSPLVLGLADGLTRLEGNGGVQSTAAWDSKGRLWFPSQSGVVRFDPATIQPRNSAPEAVIAALSSAGHIITTAPDGALPKGVRNVHIRFAAANLSGSGETRFRYRLLPQAPGWTRARDERSAVFSSLPPGDYRFELVAGNSDGVWATAPTVLAFRVPPFWYETWLFRLALMAGLALAVVLLVRWRLRDLQLQSAALDRQVRQRTAELETEKARVETTLGELAEAHHALEDKNIKLAGQADRLEKLGRFRERLLADVSHELRTPLMLVSLPLAEVADHAASLSSEDRRRVELARHQLGRVKGLVEQLVHLVQAESGQMSMAVKRVDLAALIQQLAADYRPAAEKAGVTLEASQMPAALPLFADPAHLVSIFGNLVDNAIKYAPDGSAVELKVHATDDQAIVVVRDHGPGFEPGAAERLFERFYRGDGPPRRGREGLGIGLSLVWELVSMHGGQIVATGAAGGGAEFRVSLPLGSDHVALEDLALEDGASTKAMPLAVAADADGYLLLVEDHPDLSAWLGDRLAQRLPTLCATDAEQARQLLARHENIRLVVSDVVLPGASGIELCRQLADGSEENRRPVILISAKAADRDREAGMAAGAFAYLAKPFTLDRLLQAVAEAWPAVAARLADQPDAPEAVADALRPAIEALADAEFSMARWAEEAHMSQRSLRRHVKELTGLSPQLWLREQRLLRTRKLLASGEYETLVEAGAACGLDTPAYLYRIYRARFGDG